MKTTAKITACGIVLISSLLWAGKQPTTQKASEDALGKLGRTISHAKYDGNLQAALWFLSRKIGVTITAEWDELASAGVARKKKIAFDLRDISGRQTLDYLADLASTSNHPLTWYEESGLIFITTKTSRLKHKSHRKLVETFTVTPAPPKQLSQRKPLLFDQKPLSQAVDVFSKNTKLNFYVNWRSLRQSGIDRDTPVTLKTGYVTLGQGLDLVCDNISQTLDKYDRVYWIYEDEMIKIATGHFFNRKLIVVNLNVAQLMHIVPQHKAPRIKARRTRLAAGKKPEYSDFDNSRDDDDPIMTKAVMKTKLRAIIYAATGEDMWKPSGKGSVNFINNRMIISQTALGYELIRQALR